MRMGHLAIVNESTLREVLGNGHIATTGRLGKMWMKTIADLLSDVLACRAGDLVFPWVVADRSTGSPGGGFGVQLIIRGRARFVPDTEYPLVLPVRRRALRWSQSLDEASALNLFKRQLLWNAIGKKALGRGRSLTHQTLGEDRALVRSVGNRRGVTAKHITVGQRAPKNTLPVTISLQEQRAGGGKRPRELGDVDLPSVRWVREGQFSYEKALEAWLCENIDRPATRGLWRILEGQPQHILWFGNYLSYGVQGSSIDLVVLHRSEKSGSRVRCTVFELKRGALTLSEYRQAADQVGRYGLFVREAMAAHGERPEFRLVVLSGVSKPHPVAQRQSLGVEGRTGRVPISWLGYSVIDESRIEFSSVFEK